ncbi:MAG: hypothetical protein Q9204_005136 [Flavoplaca sp. TL-2023a]
MLTILSTLFLTILTLLLPTARSNPIDSPPALPIPQIENPFTNLTIPNAPPIPSPSKDKKMKCYTIYFPWNWIGTRNCFDALKKLPPASQTKGEFHHGGRYDQFRLPVTASSGDCLIEVKLVDVNKEEESTWHDLRDRITDLMFGCAYDKKKYWAGPTRGGSYLVGKGDGKKDGMKVRVKWTKPPKPRTLDAR